MSKAATATTGNAPATTGTTTTTGPKIEFVDAGKARFRTVALDWPLRVDGAELNTITVRRLKACEVKELQQAMDAQGFLFEQLIAPFTDQPQSVLDALDQDDFARLAETVIDFLPQRLRAELDTARAQMEAMVAQRMQSAAGQDAPSHPGEASWPTSPTPSNGTKTRS